MALSNLRVSLRWLLTATAVVGLALGCRKSSDDAPVDTSTKTVKITGKVTFSRIPLVVGDNGVPTGLETDPAKFSTVPARGLRVRLWVAEDEKTTTGETVRPWRLQSSAITSSEDGSYTMEVTHEGASDAFVEVISQYVPSGGLPVRLIADPAGIESNVPQADRLLYVLRKGVAGKVPTSANGIPLDRLSGDATVDFVVAQDTTWWLNSDTPTEEAMKLAAPEPTATGSRVVGILDAFADYSTTIGGGTLSGVLDLHYRRGVSHPRGSFIEYDRTKYPKAYANDSWHFFGSLRGGLSNDDAWDKGVIATLAAQNSVFATHAGPWAFPQPKDRWSSEAAEGLTHLHPTAAFQQAAVQVLAALALKSPYLADTVDGGAPRIVDIRQVGSAPRDAFSAPNLRALAWEIALKANSLPSPGTPTDWAKIVPSASARYLGQLAPKDSAGKMVDVVSVFGQLARLKEDRASGETVDLKAIFTDDVIKTLAEPFGITWPRPTAGSLASFLHDWGVDFAVPSGQTLFQKTLTLSMVDAARDGSSQYSNASAGETVFALYATTKDMAYFLDVQPLPPAGAALEVRITQPMGLGTTTVLRTYDASLSSDPMDPLKRVVFTKTYAKAEDGTEAPAYQLISIHLKSPDAKVADYPFTLTLRKAP